MIPANLNIPDLRIRKARISGTPTNLTFSVPLETDNGNWQLEGKYNPEDLNVDLAIQGVRIPDLFTGAVSDSLRALELGPVDITASVTGQLEPGMNLLVDATIGGTGAGQWADFNALVQDNNYAADFHITHPAFLARGAGAYSVNADSVASVNALVTLERIDLQQWEITEVPMLLSGNLIARSEGLDPYDLEAYARLDSVFLRGAEGSSYVDSLALTASMHDWENEIYVRSDVMDAELLGRFDPLKTPEKLIRFIMAYWEEELRQPNPVENGSELDFVLDLNSGETVNDEILVELKMYTPEDSLRHYLGLYVDPETEVITARLEEEQILNFETWTVPGNNLITMVGDSLMIDNFALRNGRQSLRAETTEPGDVEIVFDDFNLNTRERRRNRNRTGPGRATQVC